MENNNQADKRIQSLFKNRENQHNLKLLYKFLSHSSKGFSFCLVITEEPQEILNFFKSESLIDRIHGINMAEPLCDTMGLQRTIIDANEKFGAKIDIFFIYSLENCIDKLKINTNDFFRSLNLIRDFFMQFKATFVFFVTGSLANKMIQNAFDFYDWMKFTFTFISEKKDLLLKPIETVSEELKYSKPFKKIEYLKNSLEKIKNEEEKSQRLLELGRLYLQAARYNDALEQVCQSLKIEEKHNDPNGTAERYNVIGLIYKAKNEPDKALEFTIKAAEIFKKNKNTKDLALTYDNIALINQDKDQPDKALEFALKAEKILKKDDHLKELAITYDIISRIYKDKNDLGGASEYGLSALDIFHKTNDPANMAKSYNNIGVVYQAQGDSDKALEFLLKAREIFKKVHDRENIELVNSNIGTIYKSKGKDRRAENYFNRAGTKFDWDKLLRRIKRKGVIPFIGHRLYNAEIETESKTNFLLYDYLAKQVAGYCKTRFNPEEIFNFPKACSLFLKEHDNDHFYLSTLLMEKIKGLRLDPGNPLWKLAMIRNFGMFIVTAYDNLLENTIKIVRKTATKTLSYAKGEKDLQLLDNELFKSIDSFDCSLIYHIFGNFENVKPAYAEKDVLETIMEFDKDMKVDTKNRFLQELENSYLLFMGFDYDDWLFRYLIYMISSIAYKMENFKMLIGDDFKNKNDQQDPFLQLLLFLEAHHTVEFYPFAGGNFVDLLFEKVAEAYPGEIIQPDEFPGTVGENKKLKKDSQGDHSKYHE